MQLLLFKLGLSILYRFLEPKWTRIRPLEGLNLFNTIRSRIKSQIGFTDNNSEANVALHKLIAFAINCPSKNLFLCKSFF
ncbi:hypothetical protein BpHYR1_021725 [Brachionus plicatilis]|uniref:Uncharacterized protein n=1 Tax=Brachionus plicatilis TaxID=10195 RepID=A0A3M7PXK4_BRAPC|nr:hypothetical protein BpHYR1_021725 [Brachionus plicatilis]